MLNYWSRLERPPAAAEDLVAIDGSAAPAPGPTATDEQKEEKWVLRPQWQRASLCGVYITLSLALGLKLFATRARQIHRLHFLAPAPSASAASSGRVKSRTLMFQTCASGALRGHTAPLAHCKMLLDAGDSKRVYLQVRPPADAGAGGRGRGEAAGGGAGTFILGTAGALVGGKDVASAKVFEALAKAGVPYERLEMRPKKK